MLRSCNLFPCRGLFSCREYLLALTVSAHWPLCCNCAVANVLFGDDKRKGSETLALRHMKGVCFVGVQMNEEINGNYVCIHTLLSEEPVTGVSSDAA